VANEPVKRQRKDAHASEDGRWSREGYATSRPASSSGGSFSSEGGGGSSPSGTGTGEAVVAVVALVALALALPGGAVSGALGGVVCSLLGIIRDNPFKGDGLDGFFPALFLFVFMLIFYGAIFAVAGAICGVLGGLVGAGVGLLTRQDVAARVGGAVGGIILAIIVGLVLSDAKIPGGAALTILFLACGGCVGGIHWNWKDRYREKRKIDSPSVQVAIDEEGVNKA